MKNIPNLMQFTERPGTRSQQRGKKNMNISPSFLLIGMWMGGSGNQTLAPVHAHINLTGCAPKANAASVEG